MNSATVPFATAHKSRTREVVPAMFGVAIMVRLADLNVGTYQRGVKDSFTRDLAKNFSLAAAKTLTVGRRSDGTLWLIDGLQRMTAAMLAGHTHLPALIIPSEGNRHEAELFERVNRTVHLTALEKYEAALVARDPVAVAIDKVVRAQGFILRQGQSWPYITAVAEVRSIHGVGPEHLNEVLQFIKATWPDNADALKVRFLGGIARFLQEARKNPTFDIKTATNKFKQKSPASLVAQFGRSTGAQMKVEIAGGLAGIYNKGLKRKEKMVGPF